MMEAALDEVAMLLSETETDSNQAAYSLHGPATSDHAQMQTRASILLQNCYMQVKVAIEAPDSNDLLTKCVQRFINDEGCMG